MDEKDFPYEYPPVNRNASRSLPFALGSLVLGYVLGIPAIILGIKGLHHARRNPGSGGRGVSLFSLVTGISSSLAYAALTVYLLTR